MDSRKWQLRCVTWLKHRCNIALCTHTAFIVAFEGAFVQGDDLFIVMEYAAGGKFPPCVPEKPKVGRVFKGDLAQKVEKQRKKKRYFTEDRVRTEKGVGRSCILFMSLDNELVCSNLSGRETHA